MKRVSADEFADHAAEYLEGGEPVSIENDGRVIGHYVPLPVRRLAVPPPNGHATNGTDHAERPPKITPESQALSERLQRTLDDIYARTGMTEDELVDLLDPKKPFPYDSDPKS